MNFEKYPFEKLNELLVDVTPTEKYELSALTIGEPKFETPKFIQKKHYKKIHHYYKSIRQVKDYLNLKKQC